MWDREWLESCKDVKPLSQAAFARLLALANTILNDGRFSYEKTSPLTDQQIMTAATVFLSEWVDLMERDMVFKDEKGFFCIRNWVKYQSEYARQKGYREKLHPKVTSKGTLEEVKKLRSNTKEIITSESQNLPPVAGPLELTPHRKLCLLWSNTMEAETGSQGPFNGRDGKNLVELLKITTPENAEKVILWAIKTGRKDKYTSGKCDRLYKIYENWNFLLAKAVDGSPVAGSKYKSETVNI